jgi:Tfp pilus assembly protein PilF
MGHSHLTTVPVMSSLSLPCLLALLIGALTGSSLSAQRRTSLINVRVSDTKNELPIPKADIQLFVFGQGNFSYQAYADGGGTASFVVSPGSYKVVAAGRDYESSSEEVSVNEGLTYTLMLRLRRSEKAHTPLPGGGVSTSALKIPANAKHEFDSGMETLASDTLASIPHFQKAVELYPSYAQAYTMLAVAFLHLNNRNSASSAVSTAVEVDPSFAPAHTVQGRIFLEERKFSQAEKSLQESLRLDPQSWESHFEMARCFYNTNRTTQALEQAQAARNLPGSNPLSRLLLADIYLKLDQKAAAIRELEGFVADQPNNPMTPRVRQKLDSLSKKN